MYTIVAKSGDKTDMFSPEVRIELRCGTWECPVRHRDGRGKHPGPETVRGFRGLGFRV